MCRNDVRCTDPLKHKHVITQFLPQMNGKKEMEKSSSAHTYSRFKGNGLDDGFITLIFHSYLGFYTDKRTITQPYNFN